MSNKLTIEDFPKLRADHVRMKNKAEVMRIINDIARGGANKLQVVTDFDRTITKQHVNCKLIMSSFVIFEQSPMLPEYFKQKSAEYFKKYRPIEIDPTIPMEEKIVAMEEWMYITSELLNGLEVPQKEIKRLAQKYGTDVRDRTKELFQIAESNDVPILVFSAGLGDIVEAILKECEIYLSNVKVVSNFLKFDGERIVGFKNQKLMHVFNKKEHAVENDEYFKFLKGRTNIVLMGDSIGDASMADDVEHMESVLKIGFLYEDSEKNLPSYMEKFDIVLIDDQTMDVPYEILKKVF